jgi:signal transduction histidine kinase
LYISRQLMLAIGGDLVLLPSSRGAVFVCRLPHKAAP